MRKISFLLLLFFAFGLAHEGMSQSINRADSSLRAQLVAKLRLPATGSRLIDTVLMTRQINLSIAAVCNDFPAIGKLDTVYMTKDSVGSALNDDFNRIAWAFKWSGDSVIAVKFIRPDTLGFLFKTKAAGLEDKQLHQDAPYAFVTENKLFQYPFMTRTTDIDSFLVYYYANDAILVAKTDSTQVRQKYVIDIIYHAVSELAALREDYSTAAWWLQKYDKDKAEAKIMEVLENK